ncbi:DUF3261 domain-containing protein [Dongia rigui]|uniref:DUF3261 domain-containing protein n=1 Tax=Dongia rigui TaxID=940149 RepID=A0ABU5E288_9PROT|nr:DUF3261 domain-containing protein [Dongia rigui]MDY0873334.1 DUF3261 domain-containing protein [Dongia rigui]
MRRWGFVLLLLLTACSGVATGQSDNQPLFAPGRVLNLPAPGDLGHRAEWLQQITVHHGADVFAFEGRISVTPERFQLVGLDGLGRRAMTVVWEKSGLVTATRADWLPPQVKPGAMLADIVLLYWPRDVLRQALKSSGATLQEIGRTRIVSIGTEEVLHIDDLGNGRVTYRNNAWGYLIDVQTVEVTP